MSNTIDKPSQGADMLVAVGAIMCIALGASVTYWLTHTNQASIEPVVVKEGKPINSPKQPDTAPVAIAPASQIPAAPVVVPEKAGDSEFLPLNFATLSSYYYELAAVEDQKSKTAPKDQIPQPIKALNGKKLAVQGYMVPTDLKGGKCTTFLLVKDQSLCCFGRMPRMNEWISVRMKPGKSARVIQDQPITIFGTFEVGELYDKGELLSIYRFDAEDAAGPLDL